MSDTSKISPEVRRNYARIVLAEMSGGQSEESGYFQAIEEAAYRGTRRALRDHEDEKAQAIVSASNPHAELCEVPIPHSVRRAHEMRRFDLLNPSYAPNVMKCNCKEAWSYPSPSHSPSCPWFNPGLTGFPAPATGQ